jgi:hypothetical protein
MKDFIIRLFRGLLAVILVSVLIAAFAILIALSSSIVVKNILAFICIYLLCVIGWLGWVWEKNFWTKIFNKKNYSLNIFTWENFLMAMFLGVVDAVIVVAYYFIAGL